MKNQIKNKDLADYPVNEEPVDMASLCTADGKNLAAVMLGRKGGLKGGRARAMKLTREQRAEIAKKAAAARWGK